MKKKIFTAAMLTVAALTLVVATVLATVAYLSSSTAVSNTFTVGNVGITMFESKVNQDGKKVDASGNVVADDVAVEKNADGNSYHLVNGKSYIKDPTIYVDKSSDDCYIFIKTRNQIRDIEDGNYPAGVNSTEDAPTMREQLKENNWIELYETENHEFIYCYKGSSVNSDPDVIATPVVVDKTGVTKTEIDLFDHFTIDPQADLTKHGGAKVTITAFAIQAKGFDKAIPHEEGTEEFMKHLWNVVSNEFSFENVIIPDHDITNTTTIPDTTALENN